jgi:hypothetical protein
MSGKDEKGPVHTSQSDESSSPPSSCKMNATLSVMLH